MDQSQFFRGYAREIACDPEVNGADNVQDALAASGGSGVSVRKFPFAFNTPGLLTGAALYVPTVGDILYDGWISVTTAWDGATPKGDIGTFVGGVDAGLLGVLGNGQTDMAQADTDVNIAVAQGLAVMNQPSVLSFQTIWSNLPAGPFAFGTPFRFTAANPIKVVVSQDGHNNGADPGSTRGAGAMYLVIATPV